MLKIDNTISKIALFPGNSSFDKIWSFVIGIEEESIHRGYQIDIIIIAKEIDSVRVSARLYGFSFVETEYDEKSGEIMYGQIFSYGKKRGYIRCFAQPTEAGQKEIILREKVDMIVKGDEL